jgi:hypothetical protein
LELLLGEDFIRLLLVDDADESHPAAGAEKVTELWKKRRG